MEITVTFKVLFYIGIILMLIWIGMIAERQDNISKFQGRANFHSDTARIDPQPGDTMADLLQRLWNKTNYNHEKVFWRKCIIYACIITFVLFAVLQRRIPEPIEFLVSILVLYVFLYQMNSYYTMHFDSNMDKYARQTINKLRENLGLMTPATAKDFNFM